MTKREARRKSRQTEVLQHARALISTGFDQLTMAALAKKMGASVGGLYRYYTSKEAIVTALQSQALDDLKADIEDTVERHRRNEAFDWTLVEALFDSWTHFRQRDPLSVEILNTFSSIQTPVLDQSQRERLGAEISSVIDVLEHTLAQLTSARYLRTGDHRIRALQLWGLIFGFEQLRLRQGRNMSALPLENIRNAYLSDLKVAWHR